MVKYRIIHERKNCIGCGACAAVDETHWDMNQDGKAILRNSKEIKNGIFELIVDEKEIEFLKESSECCPVDIIKIEELKNE